MEGTEFGRYRLIELLGRGGMGEVWRARDTSTNNRTVAIKLLPPHLAADPTFEKRFRREADAAAQLSNPHVIPIHNYGEIDGRLYVDMRLIEGRDLQDVLQDGPLDVARSVRIIEQVARALQAAHKVRLVHRDVKPSNILLDEDDYAYLIDFGIARGADETKLTQTGGMIGTPHYMAPERLEGKAVDARSDIYALACVLYECLTGRRPFPGDNWESQLAGHLGGPPPRPSLARRNVPAELDAVVAKGMAKRPDARYATAIDLARAASAALTPPPRWSPPPQPAQDPATQRFADVTPTTRSAGPATFPVTAQRGAEPTRQAPAWEPRFEQPPEAAPPQRNSWRRVMFILAAFAVVVISVVAYVIVSGPGQDPEPRDSALPFPGLTSPQGLAVDTSGAVYVVDVGNRVLKLAAGASSPTVLPFVDLDFPSAVAVDAAGVVYVTDYSNNRVMKWAGESPIRLPFNDVSAPWGVAVDTTGAVYVADSGNDRVLKLPAGSDTPTPLTFPGLKSPNGVAVDSVGAVYVADKRNNRVLKFPANTTAPVVLPFPDLRFPDGVAVDSAGAVYVADYAHDRVLKLPAGSETPTALPFTDLRSPSGVAVDAAGDVYVTDYANSRVLKLPADSTT